MASIEVPVVVHMDEEEVLRRLNEMGWGPEKHGRWVPDEARELHWHCSECEFVEGVVHRFHRYCPNCGARMDGDDGPEVMMDDRG